MKSQNFQVVLLLTIVALAFTACGPSEEELAEQTTEAELIAIGETAIAQKTVDAASTPTPEPPSSTPLPPTATPLPPTATPVRLDATVNAISANLHELPHLNSQVMKTLPSGTKVDLLAIAEDKEWVQVTAYLALWKGGGWLQVDKLSLNVSLDNLEVDTEISQVLPPTRTLGPTRTPVPTEVPLGERYIAHFLERGFEYYDDQDQYMLKAGRGVLVVKVTDTSQIVGYVMIEPMTEEEIMVVREHLTEAGEFLDPGHGWDTIQSALETIAMGYTDNGTAWAKGREIHWLTLWLNTNTNMVVFEFPNEPTYIGTPIDS